MLSYNELLFTSQDYLYQFVLGYCHHTFNGMMYNVQVFLKHPASHMTFSDCHKLVELIGQSSLF